MYSPETFAAKLPEDDVSVKIPLVVIVGPTAVGKTKSAVQLAKHLDGEIVSADSRLFYRGMDIGTAKPSLEERQGVPHHLIDVADPDEIWSLALFQAEARRAILGIFSRQHLPLLVGGTGQFIRSLLEGWKVPGVQPDPRLRAILEEWVRQVGAAEVHHKLAILDPAAASSIDPRNLRRSIRALEVIFTTGKRFSEQRSSGDIIYQPLVLGLTRPRVELYQQIDERITRMLEAGFIDEVRGLLERGYSPDLPTLSAIGYGEIVSLLQGKLSLGEAIILMKRRTRQFVRRQANWFKESDPGIHWFQISENTLCDMEGVIEGWLTTVHWHYTARSN